MTRKSLILAGGGMKVAFQAGVLQVWLDEAGLTFDHVDGASGGVFNTALLCEGRSGTQIADAWRSFRPIDAAAPNWRHPAQSLFTLDAFRTKVLRGRWALDWDRIRASPVDATFNVFDVAEQRLAVIPARGMTEDRLLAAVALPMWFPPVEVDGHANIDAVFVTDANIEDAIVEHGADEVWIVWTVSRAGAWRGGFLNQYFQIIEAAANGALQRALDRIDRNNAALAAGEHAEFERHITVRLLEAPVPLNYLVGFSADRFAEVVELGARAARSWCRDAGIALGPAVEGLRATPPGERVSIRFQEPFQGRMHFGGDDVAVESNGTGFDLSVKARMLVDDVGAFVRSPDHELLATGEIRCQPLGGRLRFDHGWVRLNVEVPDGRPDEKWMFYRFWFNDGAGHPLTLSATKVVVNDPGPDLWPDTTTFHTRILAGHVNWGGDEEAEVVATGVLRITLLQFTWSFLRYKPSGPTLRARVGGLVRFSRFFVGKLWDVYASRFSTFSPF